MDINLKKYRRLVFFLLVTLLGSSCSTSYLQFNTPKSAESRYGGLKTIAINNVVLIKAEGKKMTDNLGRWSVQNKRLDVQGIENLVRKALIANLSKFSDYQIIDLQDLRDYNGDFQTLRPPSGEILKQADFMLDLSFAVSAQEQSGSFHQVMTFSQSARSKQGRKWITTQNSSYEKVIPAPYNNSHVELVFLAEVIKIKNGEAKVLKNFNGEVQNNRSPQVPLEVMANELAVAVTSQILKNISKYSVIVKREIHKGSNSEVIELLESADLEAAKLKLESILSENKGKEPFDLYNLGICYEALGLPGIALQYYYEAHALNEENELYISAIGDLE
ncbi:MAG: hypothetical protein COB67_10540 [SAR324 cluster bacterium]|uniref:Tetratricopeptide repeat protein n=1 Tax=SAR324 cluster bacterium TaxID=2024889 RepID=A0A2A4SX17_9DELT|nr:MAG: hypothetical protein COB67_10540 [SAR324 cluster bacterium]